MTVRYCLFLVVTVVVWTILMPWWFPSHDLWLVEYYQSITFFQDWIISWMMSTLKQNSSIIFVPRIGFHVFDNVWKLQLKVGVSSSIEEIIRVISPSGLMSAVIHFSLNCNLTKVLTSYLLSYSRPTVHLLSCSSPLNVLGCLQLIAAIQTLSLFLSSHSWN